MACYILLPLETVLQQKCPISFVFSIITNAQLLEAFNYPVLVAVGEIVKKNSLQKTFTLKQMKRTNK